MVNNSVDFLDGSGECFADSVQDDQTEWNCYQSVNDGERFAYSTASENVSIAYKSRFILQISMEIKLSVVAASASVRKPSLCQLSRLSLSKCTDLVELEDCNATITVQK